MSRFGPLKIVYDDRFLLHDTGGGDHPESPSRLDSIWASLKKGPLAGHIEVLTPRKVDRELLLSVHSEAYIFRFEEACLSGMEMLGHPDNRISYESFDVSLLSAGASQSGIDFLENMHCPDRVFCCVRPPGHHSEQSLALGFCFLNNVAVAARYWQNNYKRKRIFILDFDAHHGNGIQEIFDEDPNVFYASIHEHPTFSFPGTGYEEDTGTGPGEGATLNIALPPGSTDSVVLKAMEEKVAMALEEFQPDCIIAAAGFDAHEYDDMSGLAYSTRVYGHIGTHLGAWADAYCDGRLLSILEGGYNLEVLGPSVEIYLGGLCLRVD